MKRLVFLLLLLAGCRHPAPEKTLQPAAAALPKARRAALILSSQDDPAQLSALISNDVAWVYLAQPNTNRWVIEYSWPKAQDPADWYWSYGPGCVTTGQIPVGFFVSSNDCPIAQPFQFYRARRLD